MMKALTMALVMAKFDNRLTWAASGNALNLQVFENVPKTESFNLLRIYFHLQKGNFGKWKYSVEQQVDSKQAIDSKRKLNYREVPQF